MKRGIKLEDITIRTEPCPGDMGYVIHMHGDLYKKEYGYDSVDLETYIATSFCEFYKNYDRQKDRVWVAVHKNRIVGYLALMHRENNAAQLRFFILDGAYRGIGLGKKLAALFMDELKQNGYKSSYLWTLRELSAAASIYTKMGFTLTEEVESTILGKKATEQRYELVFLN
jgi:peptidyl-dipeptidase Dcp